MKVDTHVHIIGDGSSGSGCSIKLRGKNLLHAKYILYHLGLPQNLLQSGLDSGYKNYLLEMTKSSSLDKVALLAQECAYDDNRKPRPDFLPFYVPNDYVLSLAKEHPEFLAAVSIHPGRRDALEELERCLEGGAAILKFLPNCQNIDMDDKSYVPFWEKMAAAKLPLLCHTGGEFSLPNWNIKLADPRKLRIPLECGVTVVAAHCATSSLLFDENYLPQLVKMFEQYPNLYADNSALNTPIRSKHIRATLKKEFESRIVHGSDLPIPVSALWAMLRGLLSPSEYKRLENIDNKLERDYQLKIALGYKEDSFTRAEKILRLD